MASKKDLLKRKSKVLQTNGTPKAKAKAVKTSRQKNRSPEGLRTVEPHLIRERYNPRTNIENEPLEELIASINENGLLQPILLDADLSIIAGHRRFKAWGKSKFKNDEIPARIVDSNNRYELLALVENEQREDLPIEDTARAIAKYKEQSGKTHEEIAKELGKSRSWVTGILNSQGIRKKRPSKPQADIKAKSLHEFNTKKAKNSKQAAGNSQLEFNWRWKLASRIENKVPPKVVTQIKRKVQQMEKLKEEIQELIDSNAI